MTDGFDQALADAGLALLDADPLLTVYDGVVPASPADHYVLVYTTVARPREHPAKSLQGASIGFVATWICHCVGGTAASARAVAQRVRTALLDVRPSVAGLVCQPIRQGDVLPADRDESLGTPVMDAVEVYQMSASLANVP